MKARSTIKPKVFWLRKTELGEEKLTLWIRIRWNIKTIEVDDMDREKHSEFEYDEQEVRLSLDADLFDETKDLNLQVKEYLKAHKTALKNRIKKIIYLKSNIETIEKETD